MKDQNDEILIKNIIRGDKLAVATLYRKYKNNISNMLWFHVKNKSDIDDIVAETFCVFLEEVQKIGTINNIESWLKGVAKRKLSDHLRNAYKSTNNFQNVSIDDLTEKQQASSKDFIRELENRNRLSQVETLISKLSPKYKELAVMYFIEQLELNEIVQKLNRENDLVRVQIHRIRKYLKENLK